MDNSGSKPVKKKLGELLVEIGILKADELPRGLEYSQKATDADIAAAQQARHLIDRRVLDVALALKAIHLAKQKRASLEQSLAELGWQDPSPPAVDIEETQGLPVAPIVERRPAEAPRSAFNPAELEAIGRKHVPPSLPNAAPNQGPPLLPQQRTDADQRTAASSFDAAELDAIKPKGTSARTSPGGLKATMSVPKAAHANPIAALGAWQTAPSTVPNPRPKKNAAELMAEADNALKRQNYQLAETLLVDALELVECSPDSTLNQVSDLLVKTAATCVHIREYGRAEQYLLRALKIRETHSGPHDIGVAECLDSLAELYDAQSQLLQAEQFYLSSLGIKERAFSTGSSEVAASLKKLVAISKRKGLQPEEKLSGELLTEAGFLDARALEEGLLTANRSGVPIGRALVSLNYLNDEDLEAVLQAQLLLREGAVPSFVAVRALRVCSQKRITFTAALTEIGLDPAEVVGAEVFRLLEAAQQLVSAERSLTPDHPQVASLCIQLGDLYLEQNRFKQADKLYCRAASIVQKTDGTNRAQAVVALTRLGMLQYTMQQFSEADALFSKLLALFEESTDSMLPAFIMAAENAAATKYVLGRFEESGRLYQLVIDGKQQTLGADHGGLIPTLQGRANCHFALFEFDHAEALYRRAIRLTEQVYGANTEHTAVLTNVLGDLLVSRREFDKAQSEYQRCLDAISIAANPDLNLFCAVLEKIAKCFFEKNDWQRCEAYYRHFVKTRHSCGTDRLPDMLDALEKQAIVLDRLARPEEAAIVRQQIQIITTPPALTPEENTPSL